MGDTVAGASVHGASASVTGRGARRREAEASGPIVRGSVAGGRRIESSPLSTIGCDRRPVLKLTFISKSYWRRMMPHTAILPSTELSSGTKLIEGRLTNLFVIVDPRKDRLTGLQKALVRVTVVGELRPLVFQEESRPMDAVSKH